jgi:hypothetical protein
VPTLSCPHCGVRGDSRDDGAFDVRGHAHGKGVYKCMACGNGLAKGAFGKAKAIPAADWVQVERRFEERFRSPPDALEQGRYATAASIMAQVAVRDDLLYEQDQHLSAACLMAAGRSLDVLAAANRGPVAERLRSQASADAFVTRAITAMAFYYLFAFGEPHIPAAKRGEWAEAMLQGLAPVSEAIPEDSRALGPLFDSFARRGESDGGPTQFALRFARWFLTSTTGEEEEQLTLMASLELVGAATWGMKGFAEDLSAVGLGLTRPSP